ncbi:hypothetical protein [Paludibaculum fermentans]|uniref:hypothetical protein n=1 Tax=Paludibaculum fermentans TaxID=1473598 RepID=UPI003EB852E9
MPEVGARQGGAPEAVKSVSRFGSSFAWLLRREVPADRIAALFATKPGTVRVAAHRWRQQSLTGELTWPAIHERPTETERRRLGIRPGIDEVVPTRRRRIALEALESRVDSIDSRHRADYHFLDGAKELRTLLPLVGYSADIRRIHLAALIHQHIAWFFVHSGRCRSAMEHAGLARDLWRAAYNESHHQLYADDFVRSALIASQAALLRRWPEDALRLLDVAGEAARQSGASIGSDHYRQRGVAYFQMHLDDRARSFFESATEAMDRMQEATKPASLLMTGSRHTSLLGTPNWDSAQETIAQVRGEFGTTSLECSMSLHWATACAFSTDSRAVKAAANHMLHAQLAPASDFGHQQTISKLLSITLDLGLDDRLQKAWARRALYENTACEL